jgi:hypothetical protein
MGMKLEANDLFPGEVVQREKLANLLISPSEHGLRSFAFDGYMKFVGLKDREALGGTAYLTNYRLLFKSHGANRLVGTHTIFLPNITKTADTSFLLTRKIQISTAVQESEFVMWGIPAFLQAVESARQALGEEGAKTLKALIHKHPEALGQGLSKFAALETINALILGAMKLSDILQDPSPSQLSTLLELLELFRPPTQ